MNTLVIINENGWRLCNDNRWRDFAVFGTVTGCVKEYRSLERAERRAKHIGGKVVRIPEGMTVDASGTVIETINCPDKPGYVAYKHHKLDEFVVWSNPKVGPTVWEQGRKGHEI